MNEKKYFPFLGIEELICKDNKAIRDMPPLPREEYKLSLTVGKQYKKVGEFYSAAYGEACVDVIDDKGERRSYSAGRFVPGGTG